MLSSTFSGGSDDEGSGTANSVMHASADGRSRTEWNKIIVVRHQQIEADPLVVPLPPHQKLTGISMARN
ncbi:hypothetical protein Tco_0911009 [Tanacetum coccineum]|uniref:Uncharacterized protein n=1 Tax=Tanacetum coccineum TaxID=301880 RepID=A0ABQ5D0T6_9ASTR